VNSLGEVVVGGYGAPKIYSLSGSVSSVEVESDPVILIDGVIYNGKLSDLDAKTFENVEVIKDDPSAAVFGSSASKGVLIISTKSGIEELDLPDNFERIPEQFDLPGNFEPIPEQLAPQPALKSSLRDNFSDIGFWEPAIETDANGEASFTVTFPDDVAKWDVNLLGMNGKQKSGSYSTSIRSYKPILAELHAPRFFTEGDKISLTTELNNYTSDPVTGSVTVQIDGKDDYLIDTTVDLEQHETLNFEIEPQRQDSLAITFKYDVPALAFVDGEKRKLPVYKRGTNESVGVFHHLIADSTILVSQLRLAI